VGPIDARLLGDDGLTRSGIRPDTVDIGADRTHEHPKSALDLAVD
jgi:hypothetical protein